MEVEWWLSANGEEKSEIHKTEKKNQKTEMRLFICSPTSIWRLFFFQCPQKNEIKQGILKHKKISWILQETQYTLEYSTVYSIEADSIAVLLFYPIKLLWNVSTVAGWNTDFVCSWFVCFSDASTQPYCIAVTSERQLWNVDVIHIAQMARQRILPLLFNECWQ